MTPSGSAQRPLGVAILALLSGFFGVFGLTLSVVALLGGFGPAIISGALSAVSFAFAVGAWSLRPWAWPLGVLLWTLSLLDAVLTAVGGSVSTNLIVAPVCLFYLFSSDVRRAFGR